MVQQNIHQKYEGRKDGAIYQSDLCDLANTHTRLILVTFSALLLNCKIWLWNLAEQLNMAWLMIIVVCTVPFLKLYVIFR